MLLSSQYLVQTVWFQLREWRKNGLEVLKLNISKGPVSRPPLSGSDCLNLVLDFGTTLESWGWNLVLQLIKNNHVKPLQKSHI